MNISEGRLFRYAMGVILAAFMLTSLNTPALAGNGSDEIPPDYVIGPEDVLAISVWRNDELSTEVIVRPDGKISMPLIGDLQAAGLTPEQLHYSIVKQLKKYQETAVASVIVKEINSYKIFIMGEVKAPGTYSLKSKTSLLQAIALAGGFTEFAWKNDILIIRKKADGRGEERFKIRFKDLVDTGDDPTDNVVLAPGDTIYVP